MNTGYRSIKSITFNLGGRRSFALHIMSRFGVDIETTHLVIY